MSFSPRSRLLPGSPVWLLRLAVALAATGALAALLRGAAAVAATDPLATVSLVANTLLYLVLGAIVTWRAHSVPGERAVWTRFALGTVALAAGGIATGLLGLVPATHGIAAVPVSWAPLAAFPLLYGGLVRWNRYSTSLADPDDSLNGTSAVLAVVAVLDVVLHATGAALADEPTWRLLALLAQAATGFVLLGTAVSITFLGSMGRDPRTWLVVAGFGLPLAGLTATLVTDGRVTAWAGAAVPVAAACLCLAALLRPGRVEAQPTDPTSSTVGAFVVIVATVGLLVAGGRLHIPGAAAWLAALAAAGSTVRMLVNVRELSQLAIIREEALSDELTGLANRRAVLRRVEKLCAENVPLVLALLDLDKFKEVNDGLGHAAGDDLLRLVAHRLAPSLRPGDLLGRLGGDEFAVVAPLEPGVAPREAAARLGDRLLARLREPFPVGGLSVHASVSVGVTVGGRDGGDTPAVLLREADAAMYDAKRSGAGLTLYDPARHEDSSGHLALVEELRTGLRTGRLTLHHQPQVDVVTGRTVGVEALIRWEHPERGLLHPAEFLPLAEVHGLMGPLTAEVLHQAVAQAARWQEQGLDLRVSVNLSASNLLDTGLPGRVAGLLRAHGLPADRLVLEVTETVLLSDPDRSLAVVAALSSLGTAVSIDDFGTGYSSLTYLRQLPVAELKLDRSFTTGLLTDARTEAIVTSTIELAHRLGLRVVAEGVEHEETLRRLEQLGCDESQGYLHARPLPAAALESWLAGRVAAAAR